MKQFIFSVLHAFIPTFNFLLNTTQHNPQLTNCNQSYVLNTPVWAGHGYFTNFNNHHQGLIQDFFLLGGGGGGGGNISIVKILGQDIGFKYFF